MKDEITASNEGTIAANALNLNADTTSFALLGRFDDLGTLRVNDNAYEQGLDNNLITQAYMIKLWHFINNNDINAKEQFTTCKATGVNTCKISVNGISTTYTRITTNTDTTLDALNNSNVITCIYNRDNNPKQTCNGYTSVTPAGEYWISDNLGKINEDEAQDMTSSVCTICTADGDYYEAAKRKCSLLGGHLATLTELSIARSNDKMNSITGNTFAWASEENTSNSAYVIFSTGNILRGILKGSQNGYVICVGD